MSAAGITARGQLRAQAVLMVDACTIVRIGTRVTDTTTGEVTEPTSTLYTGACRVQQAQAQAQTEDAGEDHLLLLRLEVQLPISVTGLRVGDEVTITTSVHDPDLPGRVFLVHDLAHKTHATARRVQCLEKTGS
jgi:hypothetical protein